MAIFQNFQDYRVDDWIDGGLMIRLEGTVEAAVSMLKKSITSIAAGALIAGGLTLTGAAAAGAMPGVTITAGGGEHLSAYAASEFGGNASVQEDEINEQAVAAAWDNHLAAFGDFDAVPASAELLEMAGRAVRAISERNHENVDQWADRFLQNTVS